MLNKDYAKLNINIRLNKIEGNKISWVIKMKSTMRGISMKLKLKHIKAIVQNNNSIIILKYINTSTWEK